MIKIYSYLKQNMYAPVLHKSPRKPDSHPVKHVPLMLEH